MIYNFYKEIGYIGIIIYLILSLLFISLTVWQLIIFVKTFMKQTCSNAKVELFIRIAIFILTLILSVSFIMSSFKLTKMYYLYSFNKCSIITGDFSLINVIRDDYRDNEEYEISFNIGNIQFSKTNINCSSELLNELTKLEGSEVTVFYTKTKSGYFIHSIQKQNP